MQSVIREQKKAFISGWKSSSPFRQMLISSAPCNDVIMASKVLCSPKAGQTALVLSQAPRAALYKIQAVYDWFHKEFLFSLLIKVLQRESEVFVFHDSREQVTVYAGRFPKKKEKKGYF